MHYINIRFERKEINITPCESNSLPEGKADIPNNTMRVYKMIIFMNANRARDRDICKRDIFLIYITIYRKISIHFSAEVRIFILNKFRNAWTELPLIRHFQYYT